MEDGRTHLRLMKEGCQEGYQQHVAAQASRTRQSCTLTDGVGGNRTSKAMRQKYGTIQTAGFNHGASHQCSTVTESIIYFRTLKSSLKFQGR